MGKIISGEHGCVSISGPPKAFVDMTENGLGSRAWCDSEIQSRSLFYLECELYVWGEEGDEAS